MLDPLKTRKQHALPTARERSFPGQGVCTHIIPVLFASLVTLFFLTGLDDTYQSQLDQYRDYTERFEPKATKIEECLEHYRLYPSFCGLSPHLRHTVVWINSTFPPEKRPTIDTLDFQNHLMLSFYTNTGYRQHDTPCRVVIRRPMHPFKAEPGYVLLEVNLVTRLRVPVKPYELLTLEEGVRRCLQ